MEVVIQVMAHWVGSLYSNLNNSVRTNVFGVVKQSLPVSIKRSSRQIWE